MDFRRQEGEELSDEILMLGHLYNTGSAKVKKMLDKIIGLKKY
jgi:hypothetical protein